MELTLILTEDCNLRCTYCYQRRFAPHVMAAGTALTAIARAFDRIPERLALTFFGGEPLLQADTLFAVLAAARRMAQERGIPLTAKVSTNGVLLTDAHLGQAARLGLFVSLSMDGLPVAQNAGRPLADGGPSHAAAERALRLLVQGGRPFAVYMVITPTQVRHLRASIDYLWEAGARILILAICYDSPWSPQALRTLERQVRSLGRFYRQRLADGAAFHLEPFDSRIAQVTRPGTWRTCSPGLHQWVVAPDGMLYGCLEYFHRRHLPLGQVSCGPEAERVRMLLAERRRDVPEACRGCGIRARCNRSCDCVNLRCTGNPATPPPALCETEQVITRAVDAAAADIFRRRVPAFILRHYSRSLHFLEGIERLLEEMERRHERVEAC